MKRFYSPVMLLVLSLVLAACGPFEPAPTTVTVALAGENEVPPVATTASGSATATLQGNTLSVEGSFQSLESDLLDVAGSAGHIHEGAVGENGPILFNLTIESADNRSGTFVDTFELNDEQVDLFNDGLMYINIHSEDNSGGQLANLAVQY